MRVHRLFLAAALWVSFMLGAATLWQMAFGAAPQFIVNGSTKYAQNRIIRLEQSLNFTQEPMPSGWEVTIWPEDQFDKYVRDHDVDTSIAFTFLGPDHTYINEYFLIWANDQQVRFVLAHEAGHMICDCKSEQKADDIARVLTGAERPGLEH